MNNETFSKDKLNGRMQVMLYAQIDRHTDISIDSWI